MGNKFEKIKKHFLNNQEMLETFIYKVLIYYYNTYITITGGA